MAICVLLNDAAMCTRPCGMTRRSRFFLNSFLRFVAAAGFPGAAPASGVVFCCSFATFAPFLACCLLRKLADGLKPARLQKPWDATCCAPTLAGLKTPHYISPSCRLPFSWLLPRRRVDPCGCARWCGCADRAPVDCGGGGCPGKPGFRSGGGCSSGPPCGGRLLPGLPA